MEEGREGGERGEVEDGGEKEWKMRGLSPVTPPYRVRTRLVPTVGTSDSRPFFPVCPVPDGSKLERSFLRFGHL